MVNHRVCAERAVNTSTSSAARTPSTSRGMAFANLERRKMVTNILQTRLIERREERLHCTTTGIPFSAYLVVAFQMDHYDFFPPHLDPYTVPCHANAVNTPMRLARTLPTLCISAVGLWRIRLCCSDQEDHLSILVSILVSILHLTPTIINPPNHHIYSPIPFSTMATYPSSSYRVTPVQSPSSPLTLLSQKPYSPFSSTRRVSDVPTANKRCISIQSEPRPMIPGWGKGIGVLHSFN